MSFLKRTIPPSLKPLVNHKSKKGAIMKKATTLFVLLLSLLWSGNRAGLLWADVSEQERAAEANRYGNNYGPRPAPSEDTNVPGGEGIVGAVPTPQYAEDRVNPERPTVSFPGMIIEEHTGPLKPRQVCERDFYLNIVDVSLHHMMIVKFSEESEVRWANGAPYSKSGVSLAQLSGFLAKHPEITMRRQTPQLPEDLLDFWESNGERNTGKDLANLNNYYIFEISSNPDPMMLIQEVIQIDILETVYYQPRSEPACSDIGAVTPNWEANQDYLEAAPTGVNANYAGNYHASGRGNPGSWCIDVEWDWTEDHEDFPAGFSVLSGGDQGVGADHGDACTSIIGACDNGYGVSGVSYGVTPKAVSWPIQGSWEAGFNTASSWLFSGESYFIEIHALGPIPNPDPPCQCNCSQYHYIAVEYWQASFDAIETHTANGEIVYEAAGNGGMDLDNAVYGNRFQRWFRDSGAILCGAGIPSTIDHECWTNYGSRLDLSGWGSQIYAAGYGDLFNPTGNRNQRYTSDFGGTSGATPIVTGSGNCLQGISQDKYGITLTPSQLRSYMSITGSDWTGSRDIGERPNLVSAINWIEPDVAPWTRSGWSYSFTPRESAGATEASCVITGNLDGNLNTTYLNVSGYNYGYSPAPDNVNNEVYSRLYLDGDYIYWWSWGEIAPGGDFYAINWGPVTVRGGRHTTEWYIDPLDAFEEYSESNNEITRQFVWSPWVLSNGVGFTRDAPPLKDWGSPTYYNGDGFEATGTWWTAVGVLPQSGNDVDLYSYPNAYSSTTGFSTTEETSAYGSGSTDFILINGNTLGFGQTRLFQAIRYSDGSTDDYAIEADGSTTIGNPYTVTRTLTDYEILDVYEFNPGASNDFSVVVDQITGGLDLAIALFQPGGDYHDRAENWDYANNNGAGGEEFLYETPPAGGWIGCVVFKPYATDGFGNSGSYRFRYTTSPEANLIALDRAGWDAPVVLRNTNDATPANAVFPAQIQGNATNYLNRTYSNNGTGAAQAAFQFDVLIDGVNESSALNGGVLWPYAFGSAMNTNIGTVRGGRHTVLLDLDVNDDQPESDETDNTWSEQYVWSPLALTHDAAVDRLAPPERGTGTYPNSDGFSFSTPSLAASVIAILSPTAGADHDLYSYSNYVGTFSGFSTSLGTSSYGSGVPDYVLVPWRLTSGGFTHYGAAVEFNSSPANFYVEGDHGNNRTYIGPTWSIPNPDTIASGGILNVYEILLDGGTQFVLTCDVLSGSADVGLRLHRDSTQVRARSQTVAVANAAGAGGDEVITYTPPVSDWYALVVEKVNSASATQSTIYNLGGTPDVPIAPAMPQGFVLQVLNSQVDPIQMRAHWDSVTTDQNGDPLNVDQYQLFYTFDMNLVGFPAGWTGYLTTDQATAEFGVSLGVAYFRMVVVAQDSDGVVLSHSPLPGGASIIGMQLPLGTRMESPPLLGGSNSRE